MTSIATYEQWYNVAIVCNTPQIYTLHNNYQHAWVKLISFVIVDFSGCTQLLFNLTQINWKKPVNVIKCTLLVLLPGRLVINS